MQIIPLPIFIPEDESKDFWVPDPVAWLLCGGLVIFVAGVVLIMGCVTAELAFDREPDKLFRLAIVLTLGGGSLMIIGAVLALLTGHTIGG